MDLSIYVGAGELGRRRGGCGRWLISWRQGMAIEGESEEGLFNGCGGGTVGGREG